MSDDHTCSGLKDRSWKGLLAGERCGKPATKANWDGRPLCAECHEAIEADTKAERNIAGIILGVRRRSQN
jgi:hypothetical protein